MDAAIDIATFQVAESEVKTIGKTVLTGAQKNWPPGKPPVNCGIYFWISGRKHNRTVAR
jgi:hypothetical protein